MTLTREQTIKAIEELKANEWMALGGMSPEAQEFAREHKNEAIWTFRAYQMGVWVDSEYGMLMDDKSHVIYRLDPSYQLPEEEPEYLEFATYWRKYTSNERLTFNYTPDRIYHLSELPERIKNYQLEGFKFEGSIIIFKDYHGWIYADTDSDIKFIKTFETDKKVFASKVVYRKVG